MDKERDDRTSGIMRQTVGIDEQQMLEQSTMYQLQEIARKNKFNLDEHVQIRKQ